MLACHKPELVLFAKTMNLFLTLFLQTTMERVDPFGNNSCLAERESLTNNLYQLKYNAEYSELVNNDNVLPTEVLFVLSLKCSTNATLGS